MHSAAVSQQHRACSAFLRSCCSNKPLAVVQPQEGVKVVADAFSRCANQACIWARPDAADRWLHTVYMIVACCMCTHRGRLAAAAALAPHLLRLSVLPPLCKCACSPLCSASHFARPSAHPSDLLRYEYELFSGRVAAASSESLVSGELEERGRQAGRQAEGAPRKRHNVVPDGNLRLHAMADDSAVPCAWRQSCSADVPLFLCPQTPTGCLRRRGGWACCGNLPWVRCTRCWWKHLPGSSAHSGGVVGVVDRISSRGCGPLAAQYWPPLLHPARRVKLLGGSLLRPVSRPLAAPAG